MSAKSRHERPGRFIVSIGMLALVILAALSNSIKASEKIENSRVAGSIIPSQYPVDNNITVLNYTAPNFIWMSPVTFNFTIDSNISTVIFAYFISDAIDPLVVNLSMSIGLNDISITRSVSALAMPGNHNVSIRFEHGTGNVTITHQIWIGSNLILAMIIFFGALAAAFAIFAKYSGSPKLSSSSTGLGSSAGGGAATSDDDTSTTTYVDQSTAPAGRIFCPECKKTIEEGSIFCPECGTRIPRYLRYHP